MKTWDDVLNYGFSVPYLKVGTSDGHNIFMLEGFYYIDKNGHRYDFAPDYCSDGASTPQLIWNILPPFGVYWMATVLHDMTYRYLQLPKDLCDYLCKEAMELLGASEEEIITIFQGVNLFGKKSFNEDRILQTKGA